MAVFDKDNRPRGLRMPSLSIKGGRKKTESPPPEESHSYRRPIPASTTTTREKELPRPPSQPSKPYDDRPLPRFPRVPVPRPEEPAAPVVLQESPPQRPVFEGVPKQRQIPDRGLDPQRDIAVAVAVAPGPTPIQPPDDEPEVPLEDFIPEPEPELDGDEPDAAPIEQASSEENGGPWTPPDFEPVAAPLNKLHFACYQDHRSMPPANNVWYPLPCMTCQKFDREVRFRCVFCCLRVCSGCFHALQKCPHRSLQRFMEMISQS
ncbi:hypothetical protein EYZ11_007463 [Aspergillus tanneri]|uniref:Uncharacterized protein n=1 Tax=Aspergillus tanneri TaxID=1220188 RepID=A0A4S3JCX4_9EURO|nr:uncharacterized protein ATNIH1004_011150 [Aspergillus tanneri]KAA8642209.1 hypothetical protein ATNIH1004_011150 [Aspergillus tanneri]THC93066.1 hypothetical protein EYZ11_007463 [Aspergillus tanneri]